MTLTILSMICLHIIADFNLQSMLGELKQKSWWKNNYPDKKYKYDYITCLILHCFSWTFFITLPLYLYFHTINIYLFISNIICHAIIDHEKANNNKINLTIDQILHLLQIAITFILYYIWYK